MTDRARIEMGDAPDLAREIAKSKLYTEMQLNQANNRIDRAQLLCADVSLTNGDIASKIGVSRRQVSRLRHGCKAAWERLA